MNALTSPNKLHHVILTCTNKLPFFKKKKVSFRLKVQWELRCSLEKLSSKVKDMSYFHQWQHEELHRNNTSNCHLLIDHNAKMAYLGVRGEKYKKIYENSTGSKQLPWSRTCLGIWAFSTLTE